MESHQKIVTASTIWIAAALSVPDAAGVFILDITGAFVTIWSFRWRSLFALGVIKLINYIKVWRQLRTAIISSIFAIGIKE